MAQDFFLKLDGVTGESIKEGHKDEIEILAWSWGLSNSANLHVGAGGGGTGKAAIQDISVTKYLDKTSPTIVQQCATGKHYATAFLYCRKTGGDSPIDYLIFEFTDVIVSSVSTGGSGGEDGLTENITLNFAMFKMTYATQTKEGGKGAPVEFGFDISTGAKV